MRSTRWRPTTALRALINRWVWRMPPLSARGRSLRSDAGQVVGGGAHAVPGVNEYRQAIGSGPRIDLHRRRGVQREVLRPRMQLDPAVSPVAAALVLVLPRPVRVEPHEWDEAFRGRPVGIPYPVVGHPKVGVLLWVVERRDPAAGR